MKALTLVLGMLVVVTAALVFADMMPGSRLIALLTAEVAILTVVLVLYASETLKVSRESLDFFIQPNVSLDCPGDTNCSWTSITGGGRVTASYHLNFDFAVWNDSATEIRIEQHGMHKPEILSVEGDNCELADLTISDPQHGVTVSVDGDRFGGWPATVRKSLRRNYCFQWQRYDRPPPNTLRVRVRFRVDYWYRGQQPPLAEREVDFVLHGPTT